MQSQLNDDKWYGMQRKINAPACAERNLSGILCRTIFSKMIWGLKGSKEKKKGKEEQEENEKKRKRKVQEWKEEMWQNRENCNKARETEYTQNEKYSFLWFPNIGWKLCVCSKI